MPKTSATTSRRFFVFALGQLLEPLVCSGGFYTVWNRMLRRPTLVHPPPHENPRSPLVQNLVERRDHNQGQHRRCDYAANDRPSQPVAGFCAPPDPPWHPHPARQ